MMRRKPTGTAVLLATLLAVCAALVPSSASAAPSTKLTVRNAYSVFQCSATKVSTDPVAGTTSYKVQIVARAIGFNAFKNVNTTGYCYFGDAVGYNTGGAGELNGSAKNSFYRTGVMTADTGTYTHLCGVVFTFQKNAYGYDHICVPIP